MPSSKKPSPEDIARGGFNPRPAGATKPKEQFGPLPTDGSHHPAGGEPDEVKEQARKPARKGGGDAAS